MSVGEWTMNRKNILLIMADQLRADWVGEGSEKYVDAPHKSMDTSPSTAQQLYPAFPKHITMI